MPKTIIVIDDSQVIREQVSIVLKQAGYEVVEAEDGVEGAAAIRNNPGASLAICDVNMPKLGGLEMLETISAQGGASSLPVIMLTTEGHPQLIKRAKASGAKGWMIKPFKAELLVAAAKKVIAAAA